MNHAAVRLNFKALVPGLAVFILIAAGSSPALGQNDTLITKQGEVLVGHYNKPVFGHSGFTVNGKKLPLDTHLYKAYSHEGIWYKSVQLTTEADPVWMQCLEKGPITLFQYVTYGGAARVSPRNLPDSYVVWLASKEDGPLLNVNGVMSSETQARANLHRLIMDQPDLARDLDTEPLTTKVIRGLIAAYNKSVTVADSAEKSK